MYQLKWRGIHRTVSTFVGLDSLPAQRLPETVRGLGQSKHLPLWVLLCHPANDSCSYATTPMSGTDVDELNLNHIWSLDRQGIVSAPPKTPVWLQIQLQQSNLFTVIAHFKPSLFRAQSVRSRPILSELIVAPDVLRERHRVKNGMKREFHVTTILSHVDRYLPAPKYLPLSSTGEQHRSRNSANGRQPRRPRLRRLLHYSVAVHAGNRPPEVKPAR